jgi:hypothetical protein
MKKVMFALCFMFGGMVVVTAQDTQDTTSNQYKTETQSQYPQNDQAQAGQDQQERERIQTTELPDEVKRALEAQEYRGWLISGAFKAKAGDQSQMNGQDNTSPDNTNNDANGQESANATGGQDEEVYIVELKNGAETRTVRFDENGQQLEGMDDMENSQNQNSQFNQDGQRNQNGQTSPNNQYNENDEAGQTDPSSTTDPADQSQSERSNETRTDESTETESPDQSTGTQRSQSTQTDQSRANEPK